MYTSYNGGIVSILVITNNTKKWSGQNILAEPEKFDDDFVSEIDKHRILIIDSVNKDFVKRLLVFIRYNISSSLKPIFLAKSFNLKFDSMADAIVKNTQQAKDIASPINKILSSLKYDLTDLLRSPIFKVLTFYYTRSLDIKPIKIWKSDDIYSYPVIKALLGGQKLASNWINTHNNRGFLEEGELIDRLRICPKCQLPSPNYIDVCPNCRSIQIEQESFLHCFSCGTVRPEKDFKKNINNLECPNCSEKLRHIGTDYDRPLENFTCRDCKATFSDPLIVAVCSRCETVTEPEDLEIRNYHNYSLSENAINAVKSGKITEATALLDDLQNISQPYFMHMLEWLCGMAHRYSEHVFTIMAIRTTNLKKIEDEIGIVNLLELVEEYIKRVKSELRTTDFTCRFENNDIWLLLPQTDVAGKNVVAGRILNYDIETKQKDRLKKLNIRVVGKTIPTDYSGSFESATIIESIKKEINSI
ncbi:MAG: diguanylate cyclase [Desulfotalea sp.]